MSAFTGELDVRSLPGGRRIRLLEPLVWEVGFKGSGVLVVVPAGYEGDGVSSPRLLWWLVPPVANGILRAAWLHDWLLDMYRNNTPVAGFEGRARIDAEFRLACLALGSSRFAARCYWLAVRLNALWRLELD